MDIYADVKFQRCVWTAQRVGWIIIGLKDCWRLLHKVVEGVPLVIVEDGKPLADRMQRARVDESDVLQAAREHQGLEHMDEIKVRSARAHR
jgi:uncharacterized membrane protein YcaP (DUF421 family)